MATPVKFRTEVSRVVRHGPDVATYEFRYLDRRSRYKPGQFLHLALDAYDPSSHWPESRVFTIANGASNREFIRLTIAAKGRFTQRILDELSVGRSVWMKAPYGEFIVRTAADHETVLIGGGTGVAPFVAFMEDTMMQAETDEVWLHYGARRADLLVFAELASRWAARSPHCHLHLYAEEGAGDGIIPGRIASEAVRHSLKSPDTARFYLCGPQAMIDFFSDRLRGEYGVCPDRIHLDQWE